MLQIFNWPRAFYGHFQSSLFDFAYYRQVLNLDLAISFKYLATLLILVSFINGLAFSIILSSHLPQIPDFVAKAKSAILNFYPLELILTIKNGELSTNVNEPYYIDPPEIISIFNARTEQAVAHFLTIDTQSKIEDFASYKTVILVTKKAIAVSRGDGKYETKSFSDIDPKNSGITIDQTKYSSTIGQLLPYLDYLKKATIVLIIIALVLWPPIGGTLYLLGKLLYLLPLAFAFYLLFKGSGLLNFKKIYQLGLHALTWPIVINLVADLFGFNFSYFYSLFFIIWLYIIIARITMPDSQISN